MDGVMQAHGGQVEVAMGDSPWGTCFSMFRDRFGIEWVIEYVSQL